MEAKSKISQIKKRDGRIVDFDQEKITRAILKALEATGQGGVKIARKISDKVVDELNKKFKASSIPSVEEIQDLVEDSLIAAGYIKTAKAYIIYREQHRQLRETQTTVDLVEDYLNEEDWQVKENSNMAYSLQGLNNYVASLISSRYWLEKVYPKKVKEAHKNKDFHLHDLQLLAAYCCGWDLQDLLKRGFGGVRGKIESKPPKHFRTALGQLVNFIYTLQGEIAGAEAVSNFDTLLAPFIRYDRLSYREVRQAIQEFLFNINIPTRVGFQSLVWDELVVIKVRDKIEFVEIGKLIDEEFEKHQHRIIEDNPGSFAIQNYDDYRVLGFNKKGKAVWAEVKAFIRHRVPRNSEFIKIRTSKGTAQVSKAHSLFKFLHLNKKFEPEAFSALDIRVSHPNSKLSENNHFIALQSLKSEGKKDYLDITELIEQFPQLGRNIYVRLASSGGVRQIKEKVLEEYKGLTPFYIHFSLKDKGVWQDWSRSLSVRYDIWKKFGREKITGFKLKNSKLYFKQILRGRTLSDFVKLCAWYISEGHNDISRSFFISQSQRENIKEIKNILINLNCFGSVEVSKGYSRQGNPTNKVYKIASRGLLADLISFCCGTYSTEKIVPWLVYELKPYLQELFIKTLLKGDGSEFKKHWDYSTTSKKLCLGLSLLLAQNGYKFSVYDEEQDSKNSNWNDTYVVRIYKDKSEKEHYGVGDFAARICSRVDKITYKKEYEYDISVDLDTENFVGGSGLLVFHNTPFSNLTLDITPSNGLKDQPVIIGGKPQKEHYGDFQNEMDMMNQAFGEVMMEGDAKGRVFTFPIPTINITKDFPWERPSLEPIWQMTAKYGVPYFSNFISSDMDPEMIRSMCCRLRLNYKELYKRGGGLFGSAPLTGSTGVVTLNMPRIGYLSKTKKEFFKRVGDLMDIAKESLEIKRKMLERFTERGLYPYARHYLEPIKKIRGKYWANHFSTIGLIGMNEALLNFMKKNITTLAGRRFTAEVLDFMNKKLLQYQRETDNVYNLEATPAEGTSYRLAKADKEKYPDIIVANEEAWRKKKAAPYYTNSTQLPVGYTEDLFEALKLQDELQCKFSGGTVLHGFLGERVSDGGSCKKLVKKIFEKFRLPYFTLTPTFSICPEHGYIAGEHFKCPKCVIDQSCEVYSRVVGYLRPVQQWNDGKQSEFNERKEFKINLKSGK